MHWLKWKLHPVKMVNRKMFLMACFAATSKSVLNYFGVQLGKWHFIEENNLVYVLTVLSGRSAYTTGTILVAVELLSLSACLLFN